MTVKLTIRGVVKITDRALCVRLPSDDDVWIPRTHVISVAENYQSITISDWIADKKGLRPVAPALLDVRSMAQPELDIDGTDAFETMQLPPKSEPKLEVTVQKIVRVFLAHSKSDSDETIARLREVTATLISKHAPDGFKVEVVPGRDDHAENFKRCGSWDAWALDIVDRIDLATREPVYKGIVITQWRVGAATAAIRPSRRYRSTSFAQGFP